MATYTELRGLFDDSPLMGKVEIALVVAANNLINGTPTAAEQKWAAGVFANPRTEADKALKVVLAANSGATVANIQGATDAAIQANVDAVVADLVAAGS